MSRLSSELPSERTPLLGTPSVLETANSGASFPKSRQEAMDDIERIRRQQEPRLTDEEYQRMLKLLSDGQNTNVSRFLYELLQNADDAHYGPKTPQVIIRYSDRYVLFESNEVGFSKANLNSICRATMSTKRGDENTRDQRRSIGEKGIGFKSVFMVATSVWINSGFYAFRFDADTPLGRVRPIWDEDWPNRLTKSQGFTSILLMLPDNKRPPKDMKIVDPTEVIRSMKELDLMDLIFLSQLKHVRIQLVDNSGFTKKILGLTRWQTTLKADVIPETFNLLMDLETHRDGIRESCVVFRYPVAGLPPSSDRPNLTTSELILVFSRDMDVSSGKLIVPSRKMYAFLPIRDYGFKFTIHSDFILVSNREDMEPVQWNREIVRRIPHALAEAVEQFKGKYPDLWVKWPLLLPLNGLSGDIFRSVPEGIKSAFSLRNVLEGANGNCVRPHEVRIVPKDLRDKHGTPFLPHSCSKYHVLSEKYSEEARDGLIELGVEYLSHESFLQGLSVFISNHHTEFAKKPGSWHDELCGLLLDLVETYKYRKVIEGLDLIPLSKMLPNGDHEWVSPKAGKVYFPVDTRGLKLPPCIGGMFEIRQDVKNNIHQEKLFRKLGATDARLNDLCGYIIQQHKENIIAPYHWSCEDMVSHLMFLHEAKWESPDGSFPKLWHVCKDETFRQHYEIYQECDDQYSAKFISNLGDYRRELHFLHPLYLTTFQRFLGGPQWLDETIGLRKRLRLTRTSMFGGYKLHEDFQSLLADEPLEALELLRHNWSFYQSWFVNKIGDQLSSSKKYDAPNSLDDTTREKLASCVSNARFPCHSPPGPPVMCKLRDLYLPREELLLLCEQDTFPRCERPVRTCFSCDFMYSLRILRPRRVTHLIVDSGRLLGIRNPDRREWDFLQTFGVFVKVGGKLFVDHLLRIRGTEVRHDHMQNLYEQLEKFAVGSMKSRIKEALSEPGSIYIPSGTFSSKWDDSSSVVWDGPSSLRHVPRLIRFYEARSHLFQTILEIPDADLATMETEVRNLIPENIDHVISVLRSISEYLEPWNQASQVIPDLTQWRMFPVNLKGGNSAKVELQAASDFWCIPVALDHQRGFLGKVNISVIFADTFSGISQLCGYLKLDSKFMSRLINEKSAHHHGVRLHEGYMERLRGKALYIASLIPLRYQTKYAKLLKNMFVYQSDQILINWHLRVGEEVVQSHPVEDQVTVEIISGKLTIHMVDKDGLLNSGYSPMQLSHLMAEVCKISDSRDFSLLIQILAQDKPKLIEADLHFHLKETGRTRFKEPFESGDDAISMPQTSIPPQQKNTATRVTTKKEERIQVLPFDNQQDDTPSTKMQEPIEGETRRIDSQPVPKASKNTLDGQIQNPVGHVLEDAVDAVTSTDDHPIAHKEQDTSNGRSGPISDTEDRSVEQLSPTKIEAPTDLGKSISSTIAVGPIISTEASCQDDTIRILDGTEPCQKDEFGNRQAQQESRDEHTPAFSESPKANQSHPLENSRVHNVGTEIADTAEEAPKESSKLMDRGNRSPQSDRQEEPPSSKLEAESVSVQLDSLPAKDTPHASKEEEKNFEARRIGHRLPSTIQASTGAVHTGNRTSHGKQELSGLKVPSIAIERAELPEDTKEPLLRASETLSYRSGPPSSIGGDQQAQQEFGIVPKTMRPSSPYAKRAPSPSRYLPSSDREVDYLSTQPHRWTNHEFMNMNSGFVHYHEPTTIFTGRDTEETRNFGELYVSEYLRKLLPETYDSSKHWTSRQRSRSFTPPTPDCSTFTIPDASGKLLEAVIEGGHMNRALLEKPYTIHVEVCASNDGLYSTFILPNVQFEKARRMTMSKDQKSNQIYILARVYKVREDPGIAMYVDPWRLYLDGSLSLQSASRFLGAISKSKTLRPILHQESTRASFTSKSHVVYRDLPVGPREIRLLKLDLNMDDEPLRGSLQVCNVSDVNHYWALSYVWGPNPTELHPIYFTVDGKEVMITESLSAFLKQLRRKLRDGGTNSVPPLLWADALCIDQNNNVEKSQQVSNMGSIFGEAKHVMVWAGTENENDAGVIKLFLWLHEQLYGHRGTNTCRCRDAEQPSTDHLPNDEDPCWPAIEAFLRREWFVRVWIIQELVLGSDVTLMCGEREIRWDCFAQTLTVCERYLNQGDHGRRYLPSSVPALSLHGVRKLYQGRRKFRFLQLIEKFYLSQSTWRRDRLFALLNLASDADFNMSDFQPDYDSGDENILAVYARGFVRLGLAPDLLYRAGSGKACPSCSWIPDFMCRRSGNPPYPPTISTWQAKSGLFSAGSRNIRKKPTVHFIKPPVPKGGMRDCLRPVLAIAGYEIDTVAGCEPLNINPSHGSVSFETLHIVRKHLKFYLRDRQSENIVIKLLIGDALRPQPFYTGQESAELDEWPPGFEEKLLRAIDPDQDGREYDKAQVEDRIVNLKFWATVRAFAGRIPGAAVCLTEKGHVGIAPGGAKPGDKIVAIHEAAVPFVVGERESVWCKVDGKSQRCLTLVGECYVDGLMYFDGSSVPGQPTDIYLV